mmetsp:Transcript_36712/g.113599  ORF Transcript_36712/g.113599 Transcript_36712/m.113599 type:complete len:83 (+) Transcript_36712:1188-1436(+)
MQRWTAVVGESPAAIRRGIRKELLIVLLVLISPHALSSLAGASGSVTTEHGYQGEYSRQETMNVPCLLNGCVGVELTLATLT